MRCIVAIVLSCCLFAVPSKSTVPSKEDEYVVAEPPRTYKLSEEQFQCYKENGFLIIKKLIDSIDLDNYKQYFLRVCKGLEPNAIVTVVKDRTLMGEDNHEEEYINKLQDTQYDDVLMGYSEHPLILDVAAQIIGDDLTVINSMFINKPPGSSAHPPHQDLHYFPYRPANKIIGVWTAIDDATIENGCLWVLPGSHIENTLHQHKSMPGALKFFHSFSDQTVAPPHKRVPLEMSLGDTVFFHPLLIHGSEANTSKSNRKCMSSHYINSHCEYVNVEGTKQDSIRRELETEFRRRGFEGLDFVAIWRFKSKEVRRRSQL